MASPLRVFFSFSSHAQLMPGKPQKKEALSGANPAKTSLPSLTLAQISI
jgi:hypothetical protein